MLAKNYMPFVAYFVVSLVLTGTSHGQALVTVTTPSTGAFINALTNCSVEYYAVDSFTDNGNTWTLDEKSGKAGLYDDNLMLVGSSVASTWDDDDTEYSYFSATVPIPEVTGSYVIIGSVQYLGNPALGRTNGSVEVTIIYG